jgi:AcrR family transcriptional regulator
MWTWSSTWVEPQTPVRILRFDDSAGDPAELPAASQRRHSQGPDPNSIPGGSVRGDARRHPRHRTAGTRYSGRVSIDWASQATPPEPRSRKGAATRQRIIEAAALLFAEHGINGVPPHEILAAAGQHNASAIQYHFGSHLGLVVAVLQPRPDIRTPIDIERSRVLDELTARGQALTLADAVRAWVVPLRTLVGTPQGCAFLRVAVQVIRQLPLADRVTPNQPSDQRAHAMIGSLLGHLPPEIAEERMGAAFTLLMELYANRAREIAHGLPSHLPAPQFEAELITMMTGLLAAPAGAAR